MPYHAKKSLGQHFLRCPWVATALIHAANVGPDDTVIEVGPGTGALTRELAKHAKHVIAIEKDERLAAELRADLQKRAIKNVEVLAADILDVTSGKVSYDLQPTTYKLVGNIPYYLTSRLIRQVLESDSKPAVIVFTVQKEVAERIVAHPPKISLLSLAVQLFAEAEIIKTIPADCFMPKPNVESAILMITPREVSIFEKQGIGRDQFFALAKKAFGQKRKMLRTSLKQELENASLSDALKKKRPQELSINEWIALLQMM